MADPPEARPRLTICWPVFGSSGLALLALVAFAGLLPDRAAATFTAAQGWVIQHFGWFYVLAVAVFVLFAIAISLAQYGAVRLGAQLSSRASPSILWRNAMRRSLRNATRRGGMGCWNASVPGAARARMPASPTI